MNNRVIKRLKKFLCASSVFMVSLYCGMLFAQEDMLPAAYADFLAANKSYATEETVLVKQVIVKQTKNTGSKTADTAYCLFHRNGQCVQIKTKSGVQYFFSSAEGYWLLTKKLKSPLKISGAYKVEEFEIQDILKTDFAHDYHITGSEGALLTLERNTAQPAYTYIFFQKTAADVFELTFADARKNPVRKLVYHRGTVDDYDCFKQIDVYNLLFDKNAVTSWKTEWIKTAEVPVSLFTYSQMKALSQKIEGMIQAQ